MFKLFWCCNVCFVSCSLIVFSLLHLFSGSMRIAKDINKRKRLQDGEIIRAARKRSYSQIQRQHFQLALPRAAEATNSVTRIEQSALCETYKLCHHLSLMIDGTHWSDWRSSRPGIIHKFISCRAQCDPCHPGQYYTLAIAHRRVENGKVGDKKEDWSHHTDLRAKPSRRG
jgi:hypothetical protein